MRVDPNSHVPVFRQIAAEVRSAVARGVFQADEPLPSVRELAVRLVVNPNTVQRAYEELEREGLITSRRGLGMFVCRHGMASAKAQSTAAVAAGLEQNIKAALAADVPVDGIQDLFDKAMDRVILKEVKK